MTADELKKIITWSETEVYPGITELKATVQFHATHRHRNGESAAMELFKAECVEILMRVIYDDQRKHQRLLKECLMFLESGDAQNHPLRDRLRSLLAL